MLTMERDRVWRPEERPERAPGTAFRQYGKEGVVVLPQGAEIKVLNDIGARIFELLDGTHSVEEIAATLCEEYDVEPVEARRDVTSFLDELHSHRMLA